MREGATAHAPGDVSPEPAERWPCLGAVMDAAFDPLAACSGEVLVDANDALAALLGLDRRALLGRTLASLLGEEPAVERLAQLAQSDARPREALGLRSDGSLFPVELRVRRLRTGAGEVHLVAFRDLTARHRASRRLDEAARRYRDLADMLPAVIGETDREGNLVFVNRYGSELLGYSAEERLGTSIIALLAPEDRPRAIAKFSRRMAGEDLPPTEYKLMRKDGEVVPMELRATNSYADGVMVGARFVLVDIRERLRAERERLELEQRLLNTRRLESLGVLAGGIAHDFNNLLAVVLGNAELALLELERGVPARAFVEDIRQASRRAADLTRQLLAYAGKAPFQRAAVDLNALVRELVAAVQFSVAQRAELHVSLATGLPAVHGDSAQLRQVALNLVTNACESLGTATGKVRVRTELVTVDAASAPRGLLEPATLPSGRYAVLRVSDTGCGMAPDTLRRIFEPFFTTKFTGRGLGLAAVLGIVRAHRGAIAIESELDHGTRVEIYLPLAESAPAPSTLVTPAPQPRPQPLSGQVLVVDDDPTVAGVAARVLRRLGLSVVTAERGQDALTLLRESPAAFDVVLLDATVGGAGAPELLRRLRAERPELPVVLCSGYSEPTARQGYADEEIAGFLQKPFDLHAAGALIGRVLGRPQ